MTLLITGPIPVLYHGNGPKAALAGSRDLLAECRPHAVEIHSHRPGLIAADLRKLLPGVTLVVGAGVDGFARQVASGAKPVEWGVGQFAAVAKAARDVGAVAVKWNAETAYKSEPGSPERGRLSALVKGGLARVAAEVPQLAQWHSSFDHAGWHGAYNWEDWLGKGSPVTASFPQFYAAPADPAATAGKGAVDRREASAMRTWASMVRAGRIRPDLPEGTPGDATDTDVYPYYQAHNVRADDTIDSAITHPMAALWAYPTRADANGRNALRALCDLHRRGLWRADGVRLLQAAVGVKVDGAFGALTAKAAGIRWEP
jgi:hypothetical protein